MKKPTLEDYHLSEDLFNLLRIEKTGDIEEQYKHIKKFQKRILDKNSAKISFILTIIVIALIICILYQNKISGSIIFATLIFGSFIIFILISAIVDSIYENKMSSDKESIVLHYYSEIPQSDRVHYEQYNNAIITFYSTPIHISWFDIIFKDGEIDFIVKVFENQYTKKYAESKDIYDDYKKLVFLQLPKIYVCIEDGVLTIKNEEDFYNGIRIIIGRYEQDRRLVDTYQSSDQTRIRNGIQNKRSEYLEYLLDRQVKGLGVIKEKEKIIHNSSRDVIELEDAYIFTLLSKKSDNYIVVFENVNDSRASIICDVPISDYARYIATIISFMAKERIVNRREDLHRNNNVKGYAIRHAYHNDIYAWKRMVENLSKAKRIYVTYTRPSVTSKSGRRQRWRRW